MRVLVTYAGETGSTREIAERIAAGLNGHGVTADLRPTNHVDGIDGYDGVVIGSAVYFGHWMKEAVEFIERVRPALSGCRVWLFSSGPLGNEPPVDPPQIAALETSLNVVEHRLFAGAMNKERLSLVERTLVKGVKAPYEDPRLERDRLMGSGPRATARQQPYAAHRRRRLAWRMIGKFPLLEIAKSRAMVLERPRTRLLPERSLGRPAPGPGQVLLSVRACGVCRTDLHIVDGELTGAEAAAGAGHQIVGRAATATGVRIGTGSACPGSAGRAAAAPTAVGAREPLRPRALHRLRARRRLCGVRGRRRALLLPDPRRLR